VSRIALVLLVAGSIGGVVPTAGADVSASHTVTGEARGQAVEATAAVAGTPTPPLDDVEHRTDVGRAVSRIGTGGPQGGIGLGRNVASGEAIAVRSVNKPAGEGIDEASHSSAPIGDADDVDGKPHVDVTPLGLTASALHSESHSSVTPSSSNTAWAAEAGVNPDPDLDVDASGARGDSRTVQDGPGVVDSTAHAHIDKASVALGGGAFLVTVDDLTADAHARATGTTAGADPSTASTSCVIKRITVTPPGTVIEPVACPSPPITVGPLKIEFGAGGTSTAPDGDSASADVDALRITLSSPEAGNPTVILGAAHARAALGPALPIPVCGDELPRLTSSGSAQGEMVRVDDNVDGPVPAPLDPFFPVGRGDVSRSDARIDEAGLDGSGVSAAADAWIERGELFGPPTEAGAFASHADAPPDDSESNYVAAGSAGSPPNMLEARAVRTVAEASTEAPDSLFRPSAHGHAEAHFVHGEGTGGGGSGSVTSDNVSTDASSVRNPLDVTSEARANAETVDLALMGPPGSLTVHAEGIKTSATATAFGQPGEASTAFTFKLAQLVVNGTKIIDIPPQIIPDPTPGTPSLEVTIPGVAKITIGRVEAAADPAGLTADIVVDAIVIESLLMGGGFDAGTEIVIGRSAAHAVSQPTAAITTDLDIHFDQPPTFGDEGATAAPHQKVCKAIRFMNKTGETLHNVVISDTFDEHFRVVTLPPGWTQSGQTAQSPPMTLEPGEQGSVSFLLEVRQDTPLGTVIHNVAVLTADELDEPRESPEETLNVGIVSSQPALSVVRSGTEFDSGTRVLTAHLKGTNAAGAGPAFDVEVDQITATDGVTVLTPLPIALGDIPPGGSVPFDVEFHVPAGVQSFIADFREVASGEDGHRFAFD
jgi:hypothetical protein